MPANAQNTRPDPTTTPRRRPVPADPPTITIDDDTPPLHVLGQDFRREPNGSSIGYQLAAEYRAAHPDLDPDGWPHDVTSDAP